MIKAQSLCFDHEATAKSSPEAGFDFRDKCLVIGLFFALEKCRDVARALPGIGDSPGKSEAQVTLL